MKVWSFGANNTGQLGHGYSSEQVSTPTEVATLDMSLYCIEGEAELGFQLQINGGGSHTTICDTSKDGTYSFHHLGLILTKLECQKQQLLSKPPEDMKKYPEVLASGWDFTLFLNSAGELYSIGDNFYGQLGREISHLPLFSNGLSNKFSPSWEKVTLPAKITHVSAGMRHAVAIGEDSSLLSWGDNSKGQTGCDMNLKVIPYPRVVRGIKFTPVSVKCSKTATIVLGTDGYFYGSGLNKFGMLGEHAGSDTFVKLFKIQDFSEDVKVRDFQCGWNHVLVLLENGQLMSWGRNNFSQLGRKCQNPTEQYDGVPGYVEGLPEPITSISCGSEHNLALGISGRVYAWGWNEHDNCGIQFQGSQGQSTEVITTPTEVPLPKTEFAFLIGCGAGNSFVVTKPNSQKSPRQPSPT